MKKWAYVLGAVAAMGATAVLVTLALRRADAANEIPSIIDDCFKRIERIEQELHRMKPAAEATG